MTTPVGNKVLIQPQHVHEVPHEGRIYEVRKKIPTTGHIVELSEDLDDWDKKQVKVGDRVHFFNNHRIEEGELFLLDFEHMTAVLGEKVSLIVKEK